MNSIVVFLAALVTLATADYRCTNIGGTCKNYHAYCMAGYKRGLCDGDENRKCCLSCNVACQTRELADAKKDEKCTSAGGKCQDNTNYCSGSYSSGKCGGRTARRCCISKKTDDQTGPGTADYRCTNIGGTCQNYLTYCMAGYKRGLCDGHIDQRCCLPCNAACQTRELTDAKKDGKCTSSAGGKCQDNTNHCSGSYSSGKCGGRTARRCCILKKTDGKTGPVGCYGKILEVETTGASAATAKQDNLLNGGVASSSKMAENDAKKMEKYRAMIEDAAVEKCVDASIIAAIISRESRAGSALDANGLGDHGNGFGLMQVDKRYHTPKGTPYSYAHILQGTDILIGMINGVAKNFPNWSKEKQLKGGISAYNAGVSNVRTYDRMDIGTTGNDYGNDVSARAQYYKTNHGY